MQTHSILPKRHWLTTTLATK